jgi:hypothetical protein
MTRAVAKQLGVELSRESKPTCESCAMAKAHQRNVPKEVHSDKKATEFNGQVMHDISVIKVLKKEDFEGVRINKPNWHLMVDEASKFKRSVFHEAKSGIISNLAEYMHAEKL